MNYGCIVHAPAYKFDKKTKSIYLEKIENDNPKFKIVIGIFTEHIFILVSLILNYALIT